MEFASEMVVRSALAGLRLAEVATTLSVDGRSRPPHLRTWRDGWRHLKFLLMYSPRWLLLIPGASMISIGVLLAGTLIFGQVRIGDDVALDFNTFVAACFIVVVGVQLLTVGGIIRMFAANVGLLPRTIRAYRLFGWLSTDRLLQIAAIFLLLGMVGSIWAVGNWWAVNFGPLESRATPRILVASLCAIVIAVQMACAAFLHGVLEIPFRRRL